VLRRVRRLRSILQRNIALDLWLCAPLFFPALAAVILTGAGVIAKWRGRTVVLAVVTAVGIGAGA
ncbi:MAG TPA: hypothetical protein VGH38_27600, partial [Bryobacteraceae bacterium]